MLRTRILGSSIMNVNTQGMCFMTIMTDHMEKKHFESKYKI